MIPTCFAWGQPSVFGVNEQNIWGAQFELLPGGSMMNAPCTLLGIIGVPAAADESGAEPVWRTLPGGSLAIFAVGGTGPEDLMPFKEEILQSYREHMMRMGMATGC